MNSEDKLNCVLKERDGSASLVQSRSSHRSQFTFLAGENDKLYLLVIYINGHIKGSMFVSGRGMCMCAAQQPPECKTHASNADGRRQEAASCFVSSLPQCIFHFFHNEKIK